MAKTEGDQNVPSELLDAYRATLGESNPRTVVGKRYPYRLPGMQAGKSGETAAQRIERARFNTARGNFADVDDATRARWYDAMPPYSSFLWYYNYFIMSSLNGNADQSHGGVGVIKSIQFKTMSIGAGTAEGSVAITAVDPTKSVVMLYGNSIAVDDEGGVYFVSTVYPYVSSIAAELVKCKWSLPTPYFTNTKAATIGITVIEYI